MFVPTSSQSKLCSAGHGVTLIQDHQLDSFTHDLLGATEGFDLISDHPNSSIVRSIQFQCHVFVVGSM
jgi:hypothetical protein